MSLHAAPVITMIPVVDQLRADAFYRGVLGLKLFAIDAPSGIFYEAGDGTLICLYIRETATQAEHTVCAFVVPDLEASMAELTARGVEFQHYELWNAQTDERGIAPTGGTRTAWFYDTEGNILALTEWFDLISGHGPQRE